MIRAEITDPVERAILELVDIRSELNKQKYELLFLTEKILHNEMVEAAHAKVYEAIFWVREAIEELMKKAEEKS